MPTPLPLPTLRRYLRQHVVTVFSVSYCPYCDAIKALIGGARTTHVVPDLDTSATVALTFRPSTRSTKTATTLRCTGDTIRTALKRLLPHHQTVPCVFVRDTFVGGYDDVKALVDNGTWAAKVAAAAVAKRRRGTRATRRRGTRRQLRVTRRQQRVRKRHV